MKVTTFCKFGVSAGVAALLVGAIALPAQADPAPTTFGTLVGLGSDTTQDVVNGLAISIGGGAIASYDANSGGASVITRQGGKPIPRASGSGAGRDELLVAIGQIASKSGVALADGTATTVDSSVVGQLDFARSSSGPSSPQADGVVAYVPFARDAVDVAYAEKSPLAKVPFFVGDGNQAKTAPTLWNLYRGDVAFAFFNADGSYHSVGALASDAPSGTTAFRLQPLLPKFGSGTRSFFLTKLGLTDSSGFTATNPFVKDVSGGVPIEEHNGAAIAAETTSSVLAVAPFSISQWVAQANKAPGVTDRRAKVELAALSLADGGQKPATTGSGTSYATNPAYAGFVRDVYNIVPSRLADDPSSAISKTFIGSNSLVCQQTAAILQYGFLPEPATSDATTCGYSQLRSYSASTSTTALTIPATGTAGSSVTATAQVTSFGNGGGSIRFRQGTTVLATAQIPLGSTSVTAQVPLAAAGSIPVTAQFVPSLAGVASSVSAASTVTVTVPASVSKTTVSAGAFVVGKAAKVTVTVAGGDPAGGTVTLKSGSSVLGSATVAAGAKTATISLFPKATSYSLVASYAPKTKAALPSTSSAVAVKVAKGTVSITTNSLGTVKTKANAKLTVTVAGSVAGSGTTPGGSITVKDGNKVLASNKALASGKVTISLPQLSVGSHKLTVIYNGSTLWNSATKSGVAVKVVK